MVKAKAKPLMADLKYPLGTAPSALSFPGGHKEMFSQGSTHIHSPTNLSPTWETPSPWPLAFGLSLCNQHLPGCCMRTSCLTSQMELVNREESKAPCWASDSPGVAPGQLLQITWKLIRNAYPPHPRTTEAGTPGWGQQPVPSQARHVILLPREV